MSPGRGALLALAAWLLLASAAAFAPTLVPVWALAGGLLLLAQRLLPLPGSGR